MSGYANAPMARKSRARIAVPALGSASASQPSSRMYGSARSPHVWLKYGWLTVKSHIPFRPTRPIVSRERAEGARNATRAKRKNPSAASPARTAATVAMVSIVSRPPSSDTAARL
jgi:hypothetical protein